MQRRLKRKLITLTTFLALALLFCARITGVSAHIVIGLMFIIALSVHTWRRRKRMPKCPIRMKTTDIIMLVFMIGVLVSGFMLRPFCDIAAVLLIHKLCSAVLTIGIVVHIWQHVPKRHK